MQTTRTTLNPPSPRDGATAEGLPPVGPVRRVLASLAVLAALPYLALKITWLSGIPVGLGDPDLANSPVMLWLNGLTMTLDVVALLLAVVFMTRRGLRAPAWLVLPPMWIGAGLLGQILVSLPVGLLLSAAAPSQPPPTTGPPPIEAWVFTAVYSGFALLGIGLLGAFALYARQRWGGRPQPAVTPAARTALAGAAALSLVAAVVHLVVSDVPLDSRVLDLVVAVVGAGALVALARPGVRGRAALTAVVVAFVVTGALTAWGTYLAVIMGVPNDLVGQTGVDVATVFASALRMLAGFAGAAALRARLVHGAGPRAGA